MNGETQSQPRLGAFAGEPMRTEFDRTPSLGGWRPPPRAETGTPDYGLDKPGFIARSFGFAAAWGFVALVLALFRPAAALGRVAWFLALGAAAAGASLLAYAKRGKLNHRDRVLDLIAWTGNERVLDIGTGRGLLMIGAAKRLSTGRAVGIDTWRGEDLAANNRESTMRNAFLEGVVDRVDVRFEDARKLKFQSKSFDVVLTTLTLHSIETAEDRAAACAEIARVLRPGGTAVVSDYAHVRAYARAFRAAGLDVREIAPRLDAFTFLRTIVAHKPPVVDLIGTPRP